MMSITECSSKGQISSFQIRFQLYVLTAGNRLEQTLSILTPFMATSLAPAAVAINTDKDYTTNAFASLAALADELESDSLDPTSTIYEPAFKPAQGPQAVVAPFEFMLEDDELSERVEIMAIVQVSHPPPALLI